MGHPSRNLYRLTRAAGPCATSTCVNAAVVVASSGEAARETNLGLVAPEHSERHVFWPKPTKLRAELLEAIAEERAAGEPFFLCHPDRWYEPWPGRCPNGHVSSGWIKAESLRRVAVRVADRLDASLAPHRMIPRLVKYSHEQRAQGRYTELTVLKAQLP